MNDNEILLLGMMMERSAEIVALSELLSEDARKRILQNDLMLERISQMSVDDLGMELAEILKVEREKYRAAGRWR